MCSFVSAILAYDRASKSTKNEVNQPLDFVYVETGTFHGLSSHLVASGMVYGGIRPGRGLIYCHDLFDLGTVNTTTDEKGQSMWKWLNPNDLESPLSRLLVFYNNVRRNNLLSFVIPIQGIAY